MKKTVKFPVEIVTHGEIEITVAVPEDFLTEEGEVFDEDGLRDWLNDNPSTWHDIVPAFEEIQSQEVIEIANVY
ncbi:MULTISPECIES: hypothetical protein [Streptomyces]|uniref:hypothetical protein n=1 Tax=Streptomyces TaxID=1883 RepID=UPI002E2931EB|nr:MULTISPECIES: hypothetical protein [Streptomyces]